MARVLWLGDAGCTTGFGTVSHGIGDRLVDTYGHDVHVLATNYQGDYWPTSMKLYLPTLKEPRDIYGTSRIVEMISVVLPDVVVVLNDPYIVLRLLFRNERDAPLALARFAPVLAYMPVDGLNFPSAWGRMPELVRKLDPWEVTPGNHRPRPSFTPVVMTAHGNTLFPNAPIVPHAVDTEKFHPVSPENPIVMSSGALITSKREAKRVFGIPDDAVLIVRVDRNDARKNYADTYRALVPLMKRNPKIHAWFHCKAEGDHIEINQIVQRDMSIAARFHWPGDFSTFRGWKVEDLATVYNAGDIFVSTSWGEGWGLTLAEAAACGLPIVAQNVSAIPEVVGPGAILLEPERLIAVHSGQDQWLPNVPAFTEAIDRLIKSKGARRTLGEAGRAHVSQFTWEESARRFHELISGVVQKTSGGPTPVAAGGAA